MRSGSCAVRAVYLWWVLLTMVKQGYYLAVVGSHGHILITANTTSHKHLINCSSEAVWTTNQEGNPDSFKAKEKKGDPLEPLIFKHSLIYVLQVDTSQPGILWSNFYLQTWLLKKILHVTLLLPSTNRRCPHRRCLLRSIQFLLADRGNV